jgi:hypothetical protein
VRFILRKFVEADTAKQALALDRATPVHDVYLREGEEPKSDAPPKDLIGFWHDETIGYYDGEPRGKKR